MSTHEMIPVRLGLAGVPHDGNIVCEQCLAPVTAGLGSDLAPQCSQWVLGAKAIPSTRAWRV